MVACREIEWGSHWQTGMEDLELDPDGNASAVTRYGLGARGVDLIERTDASGTVTAFPKATRTGTA